MRKELAPEWALLGLLIQKPMHGYELHHYFTDPSALGQVWYLGLSQMYKLLKELEKQGRVEVSVELQQNYPARKVYHITPVGRAAFWQWMEKPISNPRRIRVEFLAKLFLAQLLGSEMIGRVIDTQLEACQAQLIRLQEKARAEGFEHLVFRFRQGQLQAIIDWLKYCHNRWLGGQAAGWLGGQADEADYSSNGWARGGQDDSLSGCCRAGSPKRVPSGWGGHARTL